MIKQKKDKFVKGLLKNDGQWTLAAKDANITIALVRRWMEEDNDFAEAVYDADQKIVDEVEQQLLKKIRNGDITAICFYMKCKGKERGYIEREQLPKKEKLTKNTEYKLEFGE